MKKIIFLFFAICFGCCTDVESVYVSKNVIKNGLATNIRVISYQFGGKKDSVLLTPNNEFLLQTKEDNGSGLLQFDSLRIQFADGKKKTDFNCALFFLSNDTLNNRKCIEDKVSLFNLTRTAQNFDQKSRLNTYLYSVDSVDYKEAK